MNISQFLFAIFFTSASISIHNFRRAIRFSQAGCKDKARKFLAKSFLKEKFYQTLKCNTSKALNEEKKFKRLYPYKSLK